MPDICIFVDSKGIRCKTNANFGINRREYCSKHKTKDCKSFKVSLCVTCLNNNAVYGIPSKSNKTRTSKFLYCKECRPSEATILRKGLCEICTLKYASYGKDGERMTRCASCIDPNMKYKRNTFCNICNKIQSSFGYSGMRPERCSLHREKDMINLVSKKCSQCGIGRQIYNLPGEKRSFCGKCKKDGMISQNYDICESNKKGIFCGTIGTKKYDNYCCRCFSHLFPQDPRCLKIREKSKELTVVHHLCSKYSGFIHDKPIYYGDCSCSSRRRVDLRKLINNTLLCIEIDENQHSSTRYQKDEEARYHDIYMLHSGKLIFIRYNPDSYYDKYGNKRNPQKKTRLARLEEEINKQIKRIEDEENKELLEIIYLYYDEKDKALSEL